MLNLASVGVAFGLMTLVFQHGWFESALDFSSPGFIIDWLPLFVLVVLVGLSMDYHVFVLSRIREHVQRGLPTRLAVRQGVADTAGVVTSAAAVMVSVFSIFATLSMLEMKMMGVALSGAILLDATLIRLVMLPAILCLLGDRAWWPMRRPRPLGERVVEDEPAYELARSSLVERRESAVGSLSDSTFASLDATVSRRRGPARRVRRCCRRRPGPHQPPRRCRRTSRPGS